MTEDPAGIYRTCEIPARQAELCLVSTRHMTGELDKFPADDIVKWADVVKQFEKT